VVKFCLSCGWISQIRGRYIHAVDFREYRKIMVGIKTASNLVDEHRAIILNYLNFSNLKVGLLVNFGHYPKLEYERFVL
jgi:GxxExxY protein